MLARDATSRSSTRAAGSTSRVRGVTGVVVIVRDHRRRAAGARRAVPPRRPQAGDRAARRAGGRHRGEARRERGGRGDARARGRDRLRRREMVLLFEGPIAVGVSDEMVSFFDARGLTRVGAGGGDDTEDITVHEVPARRAEGVPGGEDGGGAGGGSEDLRGPVAGGRRAVENPDLLPLPLGEGRGEGPRPSADPHPSPLPKGEGTGRAPYLQQRARAGGVVGDDAVDVHAAARGELRGVVDGPDVDHVAAAVPGRHARPAVQSTTSGWSANGRSSGAAQARRNGSGDSRSNSRPARTAGSALHPQPHRPAGETTTPARARRRPRASTISATRSTSGASAAGPRFGTLSSTLTSMSGPHASNTSSSVGIRGARRQLHLAQHR